MENEDKNAVEGGTESGNQSTKSKAADVRVSKKMILVVASVILVCMIGYYYRGLFVAATVDGSPITRLEVIRSLEKAGGKQTLDGLVTQKVIANEIKKRGVVVSAEELAAEVGRISDQIAGQGGTLEAALAAQGMTMEDLNKQVTTQLQVEKMIGDKVAVTDADVEEYIKTNKLDIPADKLELAKTQIAAQLKQEKMGQEGQAFVDGLKAAAKVSLFVQY